MFNLFKKKNTEEMKKTVLEKMKTHIIGCVQEYSKDKGEICFIALEYFYDGAAIDIGLRIGLQEERVKFEEKQGKDHDVREDGGNFSFYRPILDTDNVKSDADNLIQQLKNRDKWSRGLVWRTVQELAHELTKTLTNVNWAAYATITEDFAVLGPYEYD